MIQIICSICLLLCCFAADNIFAATIVPSRTTGVAPLYVHFYDSDATVDSTPGVMRFHDYEYSWSYGDTLSGVWGTSGKSKNTDKGPIAAHVYETPGTYTVTLTVRDASGVAGTDTQEITVTDPDTVFDITAHKTICISTGSDFTGCPSSDASDHITTSDLPATLPGYTDAGERVLLRRGDSWTVSARVNFPSNTGPVYIGAFGACSSPDELGICSNAPAIASATDGFITFSAKHNWVLSDISFSAAKGVDAPIGGTTDYRHNLLLRVKTSGYTGGMVWSNYRTLDTQYIDDNAIVSCRMSDASGTVVFTGGERHAIIGNIFANSDTTHVLRVWQGYQGVINHNLVSGASLLNAAGRHALKFYGSTPIGSVGEIYIGTISEINAEHPGRGSGGLRYHTKYTVISNNVFGSSGPYTVNIEPQVATYDERISDLIFEKNKIITGFGEQSATIVTRGILASGRYLTIRNNVFDGTSTSDDYAGILVFRRGVEWAPLGNRVYNNTIFSQGTHADSADGILVHQDATDTIIRNNYVSFPGSTRDRMIYDYSGNAVSDHNAMTDSPNFVDPNNPSPLARNFKLMPAAIAAIKKGTEVPVFDDFSGASRGATIDIGSFEYDPPGTRSYPFITSGGAIFGPAN